MNVPDLGPLWLTALLAATTTVLLLLLGTPLAIAGTAAIWVPPSHEEGALVAWYAGSYFLLVNGVTAQMQAYLASIQELFTTGASPPCGKTPSARSSSSTNSFASVRYIIAFFNSPPGRTTSADK